MPISPVGHAADAPTTQFSALNLGLSGDPVTAPFPAITVGADPTTELPVIRPEESEAPPKPRKAILQLAGPMVLSGIVGVLLPIITMGLMGRMGADALYVRSVYSPLAFLFVAVQMSFDVSNQVMMAVKKGKGEQNDVWATALSMIRVWLVVGLIMAGLLTGLATPLCDLLGVQEQARDQFTGFLRWMSLANITFAWPIVFASTLRGSGYARRAVFITLTNASLQVVGVFWVGIRGGVGMNALPLSLVLATTISGTLGIVLLHHAGLLRRDMKWRPEVKRQLLRTGVPVSMTSVVMFAMNFAFVRILSPFGPIVVSGFATAGTVQSLVQMPGMMLGSASAIVMNRRRGADPSTRLFPIYRTGLSIAIAVYVVISLSIWAGRDWVGQMASGNADSAVETARYLSIVGPTYLVLGLVLMSAAVLQQIGAGTLSVSMTVTYVAGMIVIGGPLTFLTHNPLTLYQTIAGMNIAGVLAVITAASYIRRRDRRTAEEHD